MPDFEIKVDGDDSFGLGMDSFTQQSKLLSGEYAVSMNTVCRGGIIQTRPGSRALNQLVTGPGNNIQGFTAFTPTGATAPALVWCEGGFVYYSYAPYTSFAVIQNVQFSRNSKFIAWATCVQTTHYDAAGELQFLEKPRAVLVMQDGATRAAFWDGSTSRHLNPTQSPLPITQDGYDETPMGLWMAWSNNRLWVSRGTQVFASDIGNPLKFTESQYLNEGRAFYLPSDCTGMAETPDRQGLLCFTQETGTLLQSAIQDRTQWVSTKDFQKTVLPQVGCVAPRSIVQQYGMLWWYSARGLISLDDALKSYITSRLQPQDNEMIQPKYLMDSDVSIICGAAIENFLLQAVPTEGYKNNRILVMDQAPAGDEGPVGVWPSYWTGWRPVEFAKTIVNGKEALFVMSYGNTSLDNGRAWQLFTADKTDSGIPITSFVATKQHFFGDRDYKRFKYAEIELDGIVGPTALAVGVCGLRGAYQKVLEKDINALNGQVYPDSSYSDTTLIGGSRPQKRIVRTQDFPEASECNSDCVESSIRGLSDKAFSLLIIWSGIAGVSAYRIFSIFDPAPLQGLCEADETDENRLVTPGGCGELGLFSSNTPFETFYATARVTKTVAGLPYIGRSTQSSVISQVDAERRAVATAKYYINLSSGN